MKTMEIELTAVKANAGLETSLKQAEGEASKIRTKMDDYMFGGAKSDHALTVIRTKQSLV